MGNFKTLNFGVTYHGYVVRTKSSAFSFISKNGGETSELFDVMRFYSDSEAANYITANNLDTSLYQPWPIIAEFKC
ncbi:MULTISPECIES: hypothetical protein [Clostridium]|uniref:Uncharacterized protein n=1 Tax=Clostridium cibarium TaxID=2762247 RepID=A0ABR8PTG0_9CLOT|nr:MULTISPECIES: hypothetical protein [Clostridium]MBD7911471.1 hypothetical protein [Clostridium cibarium]